MSADTETQWEKEGVTDDCPRCKAQNQSILSSPWRRLEHSCQNVSKVLSLFLAATEEPFPIEALQQSIFINHLVFVRFSTLRDEKCKTSLCCMAKPSAAWRRSSTGHWGRPLEQWVVMMRWRAPEHTYVDTTCVHMYALATSAYSVTEMNSALM